MHGEQLEDIINRNKLIIVNDGSPTRINPANSKLEVLDYIIVTPDILETLESFNVGDDLASDHLPMELVVNFSKEAAPILFRNINKVDWIKFQNSVRREINNLPQENPITSQDLDTAIKAATDIINTIFNQECPLKEYKPRNKVSFTEQFKQLVKKRRQVRRHQKKSQDQEEKIRLKQDYNNYTRLIRLEKRKQEKANWENYCNKLNMEQDPKQFWNTFKILANKEGTVTKDIQLINSDGNITTDPGEITDIFSKYLQQVHTVPTGTEYDNEFKQEVDSFIEENQDKFKPRPPSPELGDHDDVLRDFTPEEIICKLKTRKSRSAPGLDETNYSYLKHCPQEFFVYISYIFNKCTQLGYFPADWKIAKVTMLPKPKKDCKLASNYRPISLLSCLGKLFEKCLADRLLDYMEFNNLFTPNQAGFRKNRSTTDQVLKLVQSAINGFNLNKVTAAVFLDAEKAFDKCWHEGLLYKLVKLNLPTKVVRIIASFLSNRQFVVKYKDEISTKSETTAGVPQGSCLSPVLYLIYVNDIKLENNYSTNITQFADDIAMWNQSGSQAGATKVLQKALKQVESWCRKWRVKLNPNKSVFIVFSRQTSKPTKNTNTNNITITLFNHSIKPSPTATFLGIELDERLRFRPHMQTLLNKGHNRLSIIKALTGRTVGIAPPIELKIYITYIRCLFEYCSPIFLVVEKSLLKKMQTLQNHAIRIAFKLPRYIPVDHLHTVAKIPLVQRRIETLAKKSYEKMYIHNPQIQTLKQQTDLLGQHKTHKSPINIINNL